jgi:glycerate 2-kinase
MFTNRADLARTPAHELALDCIEGGIRAAHPATVVEQEVSVVDGELRVGDRRFDLAEADRVLVVGGGNAAGTAAAALEAVLGDRIDDGEVVTDDPSPCDSIRVREGDHPVPSDRGVEGTRQLLDLARSATEADLVLALVTGGGSALMAAPAEGISLSDMQATTDALLQSGATIGEFNAIRKHLSAIKGGQLARAAAPAQVAGLVFSDVVGNDLDTIASGPTAPDRTTYEDALAILERYEVDVPEAVRDRLQAGARGELPETPAADDSVFEGVTNHVLADGLTALEAAADRADSAGHTPLVLTSRVRGEAREAAKTQVAIAEESRASGNPVDPPAVILSGGETTVTDPGDGTGGPNQEFALSAALELRDPGIVVASVDTDGIDGSTDFAGGIVDNDTVTDSGEAHEALRTHDSAPFLAACDAAVKTGATGTNVNDLRVIVVSE